MRFEACDRGEVRRLRVFKVCRNQQLLEDFIDSDLDCAEVKDFTHINAKSCQSSLTASARRFGVNKSVKVILRDNRVFLIRAINE